MRWWRKSIDRLVLELRIARMRRRAPSPARSSRLARRLIHLERFAEADAVLKTALAAFPGDVDLLQQYAMSAHHGGRYEAALTRWEDVRRADPGLSVGWCGVAATFREFGHLPSADRAIREALHRFPEDPSVAGEAGLVAEKFIDLERSEEADALLETALAVFPGDVDLLHQYAMSAHQSGRYAVALTRWEDARRADPDHPMAWCGVAANLRELGHMPSAEQAIREALQRFPEDMYVAGEAARVFDQIGAYAETAAQWQRLMAIEPPQQEWLRGLAYSLAHCGKIDEAREVLARARVLYPDDRDLLATEAVVEMACENWNGALAVWRVYRARYPDEKAGWEGQGKTLAAIALARAESPQPDDAVKAEIETVEDDAMRSLMLGFESIGADCEFGLVQRRFGAEPLGLLRFNNVQLQDLLQALEAGFARMGEADVTRMFISVSGEFYVEDVRWHLGMHTFMFSSQYKMEDLLPKMHRRVAFLREKLVADLRGGEKVFVFKTDGIDLARLRELHRRLRALGPVRLLHVRQASVPLTDEPLPVAPGQVFRIEPDLWVGFLGRMGNTQPQWDIAFDDWVSICRGLPDAPPLPVIAQLVQELS